MKTLVEYAKSFLGIRYQWGGKTPIGGLDCSGLVEEILRSIGMLGAEIDSAQMIYSTLSPKAMSSNKGPGALIFFGENTKQITHIGFMINDYQMIEAGGGTASVKDLATAIEHSAYVKIRPITHRNDCVAIFMPNYPLWVLNE